MSELTFLKEKFFDINNHLDKFITKESCLLKLESEDINENIKKSFVNQFIQKIVEKKLFSVELVNSVTENNAWSIDFPSWHGSFNVKEGKSIFIIGAEPHIHFKYLQTVYGFNNENTIENYLNDNHYIFNYISELLYDKLKTTRENVLNNCYLTDLFPLSPFRGNGLSVGSQEKIQKAIGKSGNWAEIRRSYAKENLLFEIKNVNPKIIITQGKQVFEEVIRILNIKEVIKNDLIKTIKGKNQYVRSVKWNNIIIISVPHIGSRRMQSFWKNNLNTVKQTIETL
jgi:hypothetical protein